MFGIWGEVCVAIVGNTYILCLREEGACPAAWHLEPVNRISLRITCVLKSTLRGGRTDRSITAVRSASELSPQGVTHGPVTLPGIHRCNNVMQPYRIFLILKSDGVLTNHRLEWRCLRSIRHSNFAYGGAQSEGCGTGPRSVRQRLDGVSLRSTIHPGYAAP